MPRRPNKPERPERPARADAPRERPPDQGGPLAATLGSVAPLTVGDVIASGRVPAPPSLTEQEATARLQHAIEAGDARYEAIERARAQEAGIDYAVWQTLSRETRDEIASRVLPHRQLAAKERAAPDGRNQGGEVEFLGTIGSEDDARRLIEMKGLRGPEEFATYAHGLLRPEHFNIKGEPVVTVMCDPPITLRVDGREVKYHPDVSFINLVQVEQKRRQGFTAYPLYPFLPPPDKECPISDAAVFGPAARACAYKGRTEDEVEDHMMVAHPQEYRRRRERLARERQEQESTVVRTLLETLVRQGTGGGNDTGGGNGPLPAAATVREGAH